MKLSNLLLLPFLLGSVIAQKPSCPELDRISEISGVSHKLSGIYHAVYSENNRACRDFDFKQISEGEEVNLNITDFDSQNQIVKNYHVEKFSESFKVISEIYQDCIFLGECQSESIGIVTICKNREISKDTKKWIMEKYQEFNVENPYLVEGCSS